jgi:hypothetical protein
MRCKNQTKLPTRIYFINYGNKVYGPYISRPTNTIKELGDPNSATLVSFLRDTKGNYIKED